MLPQPKFHQVTQKTPTPYDLIRMQLGTHDLLEKLAGLELLDGVLIEDQALDYTRPNLIAHKLDRVYRGFLVVRRQVPPSSFRATLSAAQSINSATPTVVGFDTVDFDSGADFDTTNNKFTAPVNGTYWISTNLSMLDAVADGKFWNPSLRKNGSTNLANQTELMGSTDTPAGQVDKHIRLVKGDYVQVLLGHNHGAARQIDSTATETWFEGGLIDSGISEDKDQLDAGIDRKLFLPLRCSFDQLISLWVF